MFRRSRITATAGGLLLLLAACTTGTTTPATPPHTALTSAPSAPVTPAALDGPPVTLKLAVADPNDRPSRPAIDDLVQQVAELSGGKVTIVPEYSAGDPRFEEGVMDLVMRGDADLGLVSSRAWDLVGETSLQALTAPFLIDNDALMDAVASGDVGRQAIGGLRDVVGLAIWPEELRYVAAFASCGLDLTDPAAMRGATFHVSGSALARRVVTTLGAEVYQGADRNIDALACRLRGIEVSMATRQASAMDAKPVAHADLVLWPKFQVLVAGKASHAALGDAQRAVLEAAATAVAAGVMARRATAGELGKAFCAAGGQIRTSGASARQAWETAVKPVVDDLETDPGTAAQLEAIRTLKATLVPSAGPAPCGGGPVPSPVPVDEIDTTGYVGTMLPNGTYRRELIAEDLIAAGLDTKLAHDNEQVLTYVFDDGRATFRWDARDSGTCEGTYRSVDGKFVEFTDSDANPGCGLGPRLVWREEPNGISFITLDPTFLPSDHILLDYWVWTRIK